MNITYKDSRESSGLDFVLSDETKDRMGDVIRASGWDLVNFKKNPIALFRHDSGFPIGNWTNLRVDKKRLIGTLEPAPAGTSPRIDEINKLVRAGVLKAVSVGFREIESRPFSNDYRDGTEFIRQELVETSVVSIPANPNALNLAKELGVSDEVRSMIFAPRQSAALEARCAELVKQLAQQRAIHDRWSIDFYDMAHRHLTTMAGNNPHNELWAIWRDEMAGRKADFLHK